MITPEQLDLLCEVARKHGVLELETPQFRVRLGQLNQAVQPDEKNVKEKQKPRANLLDKALSDDPLGE